MSVPAGPMRKRGERPATSGGGAPPPPPPPGHEQLLEAVHALPRQRTYLLPALHTIQHTLGWLPDWALELTGAHLRVPKSEVYGIASSFPELRLEAPPMGLVRACMGASCRQRGARLGPDNLAAECLFTCGVGPVLEVDGVLVGRGGSRAAVASVAAALVQDGTCSRAVADTAHGPGTHVGCAGNCWQAPSISLDGGQTWVGALDGTSWQRPGEARLLRNVGLVDPLEGASMAYAALEQALGLGGTRVWEIVKASGLRGRGGAYFPVGTKWETARNTPAERKFLLVNAEEGEPGIYKDRHLLEGDPHTVIEGVQIAALGIGATEVVIFVNGEAHLAHERLLAALERARQHGVVRVPVQVRQGAGGYVLGEETALINAIHGMRSEPLARPPFPAVSGLFASPTVINNVETLANLPGIIGRGAEWFRSVGTDQTPGTKLVSLAGAVHRPGLYEVPIGTSLRTIVDSYGGGATGELEALLVGGPSGSILPPSLLDTPLDVQSLQAVGGVLGAGGIVPVTSHRCVVDLVRQTVAYNARESCGKCTPCREGTQRVLELLDDLCQGRASQQTLRTLDELNDVLAFGSLCGLGQMAPNPVRALLRHFPDAVREHLGQPCPRCAVASWTAP